MKTMEFNEARRAAMARTILTTDDEAYTLPATLLRELMDTAAQQDAQGLTLTDEELNREMQQW
nr:hypothetical protein [Bacteroides intestinalis]